MDIRTERLRNAFNNSNFTQTELCEKTGINKGALSSYLSGRYFPKQAALEQLSKALKVSITYLMGIDDAAEEDNYHMDNRVATKYDFVPVPDMFIGEDLFEYESLPSEEPEIRKCHAIFSRLLSYSDDELEDLVKYMDFIESKRKTDSTNK